MVSQGNNYTEYLAATGVLDFIKYSHSDGLSLNFILHFLKILPDYRYMKINST